mgnify:CR=1 FL=1
MIACICECILYRLSLKLLDITKRWKKMVDNEIQKNQGEFRKEEVDKSLNNGKCEPNSTKS